MALTQEQLDFFEGVDREVVAIPTLTFTHPLIQPTRICLNTENSEFDGNMFTATNFTVQQPSFSEKIVDSKLIFSLDISTNDIVKKVSLITKSVTKMKVGYSTYSLISKERLFGELKFTANTFSLQDNVLTVECSYHAFVDSKFPSKDIDTVKFPGLKYVR